ncbi:hypothetical protein D3C77_388240 [compost metagenome]
MGQQRLNDADPSLHADRQPLDPGIPIRLQPKIADQAINRLGMEHSLQLGKIDKQLLRRHLLIQLQIGWNVPDLAADERQMIGCLPVLVGDSAFPRFICRCQQLQQRRLSRAVRTGEKRQPRVKPQLVNRQLERA